jgi:ornithine carbamoyltransferase
VNLGEWHYGRKSKGRSLLTLMDYTPEEIRYLLDLAHELKKRKGRAKGNLLSGKISSCCLKRLRPARAAPRGRRHGRGGRRDLSRPKSSQMGKKESIADSARVLGRFYDGIEFRGYDQKTVERARAILGVPFSTAERRRPPDPGLGRHNDP